MKSIIIISIIFIFCRTGYAQQQAFIRNVPDYSQPPMNTLPSSTDTTNYCAPFALLNVIEYWDSVQMHPYARGLLAGLPANEIAEYIGWFMDTNNQGSPGRENGNTRPAARGTYVLDQWFGAEEYLLFNTNNNFMFPYTIPSQKKSYGWDIQLVPVPDFMIFKEEIDLGNPVKLDFMYWNISPTGEYIYDSEFAEDTIFIFEWGSVISESGTVDERDPSESWNLQEGDGNIGHAVTAIGYIENYVQDTSYVIVHDNWANTPQNIAVPWLSSKITAWFFYHLPEPPDLAVTNIQVANDTSVGFIDSLKINEPVIGAVTIHNLGSGPAVYYMNTIAIEDSLGNPVVIQSKHLNVILDPQGTGQDSLAVYFDNLFTPTIKGTYNIKSWVYWDMNGDSLENDSGDMDTSNDTLTTTVQVYILSSAEANNIVIQDFRLLQNYPNPFNPLTKIKYQIPQLSFVTLKVYDVLGREIGTLVNEEIPAGIYEVEFDATNLPSGIYFYQLKAGPFFETKKMILLK